MKYFIFLIFVGHCSCMIDPSRFDKTWNNYERNDLRNWNTEVAVEGLFFSVIVNNPMAFYSHNKDMLQLIIPMNSDANDTNFSWTPVDSKNQVSCPDQENENSWWLDPRNWDSDNTNNATPHLERIPCAHDTVLFKKSPDLYVILPNNRVTIQMMYWNDQTIHRTRFNRTSHTEQFIKTFIVTGKNNYWDIINITDESCKSKSGCQCGTMAHFKETCKILEDECKTSLPCSYPQMATGHCCEICGCTVQVIIDEKEFNYEKTRAGVVAFFNTTTGVSFHMSRTSGVHVQIIIILKESNDDYDNISNIAKKLGRLLKADSSQSQFTAGILDVQYSCSNKKYSNGSLIALSEVMIPLFTLVSLIILVLLFKSKISLSKIQNMIKSSVGFSKFENESEKSEEQSQFQKQQNQENAKFEEESKNIQPELHSEDKSENGTSSELDDSVLVDFHRM